MKTLDRSQWVVAVSVTLAVGTPFLTAGCSQDTALEPPPGDVSTTFADRGSLDAGYGSGSFYPLGIGNEWQYEGRIRAISLGAYPAPSGDTLAVLEYVERHRIIGEEEIDGRSYRTREERRIESTPADEHVSWSRLRQDRDGLFAADVDASGPPAGSGAVAGQRMPSIAALEAALGDRGAERQGLVRLISRWGEARRALRAIGSSAGPSGTELVWLLYPLRMGLSWDIRTDFPWPARVDGIETLKTPTGRIPAYRIETDPFGSTVGEGEWIRLYYGRRGYLGYSIHLVDPGTSPGDTYVVFDDAMLLTSSDLAR